MGAGLRTIQAASLRHPAILSQQKIEGGKTMQNEYTRQRQGRDFPPRNDLQSAEMSIEGNYNNIDGIIGNNDPKDDGEKKRSLLEQLEVCKAEAERNAVPVDGFEPRERDR